MLTTIAKEISITQMASILDPRYKNMSFESSENIKNRIKQIVRSKMVRLSRNTDVRIPTEKRTALDELLEEEPNNDTDEFSRYMAEFQINHNADPCAWWKDHENIYPTLAVLAKQIRIIRIFEIRICPPLVFTEYPSKTFLRIL